MIFTLSFNNTATYTLTIDGGASYTLSQRTIQNNTLSQVIAQTITQSASWGDITGTLSSQTDLQTALNGKEPLKGADDNFVTDAEKIVIGNTSGTNTGDQDLSGYSLTTHNHTGTYEPLKSADDNYVTDAQLVVIGNTSGTNTGDQNLSGYQTTANLETTALDTSTTKYPCNNVVKAAVDGKAATSHTHARTEEHFVTVYGEIKVPSGDVDFINTFPVSIPSGSLTLKSIRYYINSGTSVSFRIQKGGADITGYGTSGSPLSCTTTAADTTQDATLANNDVLSVLVSAVAGTPKNMTVAFRFERTQ